MSVLARVLCLLVLAGLFGSVALVDAKPRQFLVASDSPRDSGADKRVSGAALANLAQPQLGAFSPMYADAREGTLRSPEPFDLPASAASAGETVARWNELQPRIRADLAAVAGCQSGHGICSPAARRFLSIVEIGRGHQGRKRLAWINRAVNLSITPMSDWAQYGYADYWASPLQTLGSRAGDCEDYAIVKYGVLRVLGYAADDLRLVIVRDSRRETDHTVVGVRDQGEWLVLDNRTMATINATQDGKYDPLFVMDDRGVRAFSTTAARR
jgi:predicted transglutaminase-like cysteine proteinase